MINLTWLMILTEPAEGRLSRPYDEVVGTGGLQDLSAKVRKSYGIQPELTGARVRATMLLRLIVRLSPRWQAAALMTRGCGLC